MFERQLRHLADEKKKPIKINKEGGLNYKRLLAKAVKEDPGNYSDYKRMVH